MYVGDDFLSTNRTPIYPKRIGPGVGGGLRAFKANRAVPFSRLGNEALIDTTDLCQLFGCSARSVYRWVSDRSLFPVGKIGREFLFKKGEILRWFDTNRPVSGRPPVRGR